MDPVSDEAQEAFPTSAERRTTYIKALGDNVWRPITYALIDGMAIYQGCIVLGTEQDMEKTRLAVKDRPTVLVDPKAEGFGVAIKGEQYRWANKCVPYVISAELTYRPERVANAIAYWEQKTPFRFPPRGTKHDNYIEFRAGNGCMSSVGCQGGRQYILLADRCTTGNVIHEIGHAVGLWHEQSRADRDLFVTIDLTNVSADARHNFDKHVDDGVLLGEYDFGSIMHYGRKAFAIDASRDTITPRTAGADIGQREKLSTGDITAIEKL